MGPAEEIKDGFRGAWDIRDGPLRCIGGRQVIGPLVDADIAKRHSR